MIEIKDTHNGTNNVETEEIMAREGMNEKKFEENGGNRYDL